MAKNLYESGFEPDYLIRNRVSGIFYVRKGDCFQTTGERVIGRARAKGKNILDRWHGHAPKDSRPRTVEDVAIEHIESLRQECVNKTRRRTTLVSNEQSAKFVIKHLGDRMIGDIDEDFLTEWFRTEGHGIRKTLFDVAKHLSMLLSFAHRRGYIMRKPKVKNPDRKKKTGTTYTGEQVRRLVTVADRRTMLQVVLAYECGMRPGEVRGLEWDMVEVVESGAIRITLPDWFVKANPRAIQVSPYAAELLSSHPRVSRFVFPSPQDPGKPENRKYQNKRWRMIRLKAGITHGRFMDLRHSFYTKTLLELGMPIQTVSEYGGTSIRTLQKVYLHGSAERTAQVAAAVKIFGGKNVLP